MIPIIIGAAAGITALVKAGSMAARSISKYDKQNKAEALREFQLYGQRNPKYTHDVVIEEGWGNLDRAEANGCTKVSTVFSLTKSQMKELGELDLAHYNWANADCIKTMRLTVTEVGMSHYHRAHHGDWGGYLEVSIWVTKASRRRLQSITKPLKYTGVCPDYLDRAVNRVINKARG